MSFLSSIYSKLGLSSSSRTKRAEHSGETPDDQYPHFMEEIDPDGFVLLTDSRSKRCKTIAHEFHENIEHIGVQQATSCPSGLHLPCAREGLVTRGKPSQQKDFVTASDLPFKFSKPLQVLFKMSLDKTEFKSLNIKQYDYDFSLERTVLALYDDRPLTVK